MEDKEKSISGLYYRYKTTSDEKIREVLSKTKIVIAENKGIGTLQGYYTLNKESMAKILDRPRNISLSFDATQTENKPLKGLKEWKTIKYLVKSTSRFFLKPDIGEIIDQIDFRDLFFNTKIKAIQYIPSAYQELEDTSGEHFIMVAKLLIDENDKD